MIPSTLTDAKVVVTFTVTCSSASVRFTLFAVPCRLITVSTLPFSSALTFSAPAVASFAAWTASFVSLVLFFSAVTRSFSACTLRTSALFLSFSASIRACSAGFTAAFVCSVFSAAVLALSAAVVAAPMALSARFSMSPILVSTPFKASLVSAIVFSASFIRLPISTEGASTTRAVSISTLSSPSCGSNTVSPEALLSTI